MPRARRRWRAPARGTFVCISPWNFPLAIFTGQIAAALAAGNAVIAKPAEQTPLIAALAVRCCIRPGCRSRCLQLLPGDGARVGAALTSRPARRWRGLHRLDRDRAARSGAMAAHLAPGAPLIAETGGLNAMIVDSHRPAGTGGARHRRLGVPIGGAALFGVALSLCAGGYRADRCRRCWTARWRSWRFGDPWELATDVGPVIDAEAQADIAAYVATARAEGRVLKSWRAGGRAFHRPGGDPGGGHRGDAARDLRPGAACGELQGRDLAKVSAAINATGYGLTFGLHTRIDNRVQQVVEAFRSATSMSTATRSARWWAASPSAARGCRAPDRRRAGRIIWRASRRAARPEGGAWDAPADEARVRAALRGAPGARW